MTTTSWIRCPALAVLLLTAWPAAGDGVRDPTALDVSIVRFDPGIPADSSLHRELQVFPRIREIEAKLLPFVLRETLVESGEWGAVRVVPEADPAAELLVSGVILRSDGDVLDVAIRALDASGRIWIDGPFSVVAGEDGPEGEDRTGEQAFRQLYEDVAGALLEKRNGLDDKTLRTIADLSLLRYAAELAPSAFGDYFEAAEDGRFELRRLPASDDPMLQRIDRIRHTEYVITDTVDAKYRELNTAIDRTYRVWRSYRRKFVEYQAQNAARAARKVDAPRGSYEALKAQYDTYKWDRITAQEQYKAAAAFDTEVGPTVDAMEVRVAELEAWVDARYLEWRRLLEALFEVETRQEPGDSDIADIAEQIEQLPEHTLPETR